MTNDGNGIYLRKRSLPSGSVTDIPYVLTTLEDGGAGDIAIVANGNVFFDPIYSGASGPCDFDDKGDILSCKFRYEQIKAGKFTLVKIA